MVRKVFLINSVAGGAAVWAGLPARAMGEESAPPVDLPLENGRRRLVAYPQKRPLLVLTSRPVQLETPFSVFDEGAFTPNDAFFVRWHLAGMPTAIDEDTFTIRVRGNVERELSLSVGDLRRLAPVEIAAVCECAGNSRGFSTPRVPGGQWANGAMGSALWTGARLRDVLRQSGLKAGSVQVRFNGADVPVLPATPDFRKSLDVDLALADDTLLAYAMNGRPLPLLNGFPVRLVVPGYFATYWVKMIDDIEVLTQPDDNFWMKTAYRIPATPTGGVEPGATGFATTPIGKLTVRSFITNFATGRRIAPGLQLIRGLAFDGGSGIKEVDFSPDGGITWERGLLGPDHGRYGFRAWTAAFTAEGGKRYTLLCRATSNAGDVQPSVAAWNPSGYQRNVIEQMEVRA